MVDIKVGDGQECFAFFVRMGNMNAHLEHGILFGEAWGHEFLLQSIWLIFDTDLKHLWLYVVSSHLRSIKSLIGLPGMAKSFGCQGLKGGRSCVIVVIVSPIGMGEFPGHVYFFRESESVSFRM